MGKNITIIGLGEIGTSLAMALTQNDETNTVVGSDIRRDAESYARDGHFVTSIEHNCFDAVKDADLVILAVPSDQTRAFLELTGHDLKENAVVLDCSPTKQAAAGWARQYMDHPENFAGVWFGMNPDRLREYSDGGRSAHADLFKGGSLLIAPDTKTAEGAIQTAADLGTMLGMKSFFFDILELDGMIAAAYQLPILAGNGLIGCLSQRTGWTDGKKVAGKTFYGAISPVMQHLDEEDSGAIFLNNRENSIRLLNEYIRVLVEYRDALKANDQAALHGILEDNREALAQWEKDYRKSNTAPGQASSAEHMSSSNMVEQIFLGGFLRKKIRKD